MKYKKSFWLLTLSMTLFSCQKEPDWSEQSNEYMVYTQKDADFNADAHQYYFIADSILLIDDDVKEKKYLKGTEAQKIITEVIQNMDRSGYTRVMEKEQADLGLQLSYIYSTRYFTSYPNTPYWWWDYPGYWDPFYWGSYWNVWGYGFPVSYSYSENSLLGEMVDLKSTTKDQGQLSVVWNMYINGDVSGYRYFDSSRMLRGIDQAFNQSAYLNKQQN